MIVPNMYPIYTEEPSKPITVLLTLSSTDIWSWAAAIKPCSELTINTRNHKIANTKGRVYNRVWKLRFEFGFLISDFKIFFWPKL